MGGVPEGRGGFGKPDCGSLLDSIIALRLDGAADVEDQVNNLECGDKGIPYPRF